MQCIKRHQASFLGAVFLQTLLFLQVRFAMLRAWLRVLISWSLLFRSQFFKAGTS